MPEPLLGWTSCLESPSESQESVRENLVKGDLGKSCLNQQGGLKALKLSKPHLYNTFRQNLTRDLQNRDGHGSSWFETSPAQATGGLDPDPSWFSTSQNTTASRARVERACQQLFLPSLVSPPPPSHSQRDRGSLQFTTKCQHLGAAVCPFLPPSSTTSLFGRGKASSSSYAPAHELRHKYCCAGAQQQSRSLGRCQDFTYSSYL